MASNPFTASQGEKNNVRRNVWDWTHYNNLTTEIGRLTPCFCRRVPAGTSLRINADFALKFMPMMFPIQSRIKARLNFFRMPVRALWKNYPDWISSINQKAIDGTDINSKYIPPHISISDDLSASDFLKYFGTSSDLDYLGLPTTMDEASGLIPRPAYGSYYCFNGKISGVHPALNESSTITIAKRGNTCSDAVAVNSSTGLIGVIKLTASAIASIGRSQNLGLSYTDSYFTGSISNFFRFFTKDFGDNMPSFVFFVPVESGDTQCFRIPISSITSSKDPHSDWVVGNKYTLNFAFDGADLTALSSFLSNHSSDTILGGLYCFIEEPVLTLTSTLIPTVSFTENIVSSDYSVSTCPWYNSVKKTGLKVSSLPLRMREAVYNAYIRNDRNNPLIVNGIPRYNDWVLAYDSDGDDTDNYSRFDISGESSPLDYFYGRKYVNWEPDWLTTAVPSPQEGIAPLVGLTQYASVVSSNDGADTVKLNSVLTDEDGNSYAVNYISDKEGLKGVTYTELSARDEFGKPISNLYQAVSSGISIEDFRQVNAFQRYLELNMRRGYSYKDIIEGRYDVNVRYDALLLPEFLGGFTRDVSVTPVTQTTPTDESGTYQGSLGSQAGDAYVAGSPDVSINCYCDEESIVMGFVSVSPVPIYSQTLLRDFLINDPLDIFSPEFSNIGFQPIPLAEVSPIQAFNSGGLESLSRVFGYQRPWYELLSMTDQAHGLFRSQLKNFIMKRTWSGVPVLGLDFLLVKPDQVNDVFSVTETSDKIFGQIKFDIKCKNEIPRDVVPRLE